MGDARSAALKVLERSRRGGAWSDALLGSVMDREGLSGPDRGLAAALAYGVLQNRMLLDHVIAEHASVPLRQIEPKVLDILRLGACQILLMDRIPASAAVDTAVQLAKQNGASRAAGFVNALLRRISEDDAALPTGQDVDTLSLRWSHPRWLTELYVRLLGSEEAETLLRMDNAAAPITLQTNTLKTETQSLLEALRDESLDCRLHPGVPDCILLERGAIHQVGPFRNGQCYVQDAAAKLAVMAAAPQRSDRILDACAAPGGKTFAASILSGGAEIVSCDIHENKLRRIEEGAKRLGLENISFAALDARSFQPQFAERFDIVIADVPCSGLGVIRKKPDIRYKDPEAFSALPAIQSAILRNVSRYVRPGGTLLYSTCTIRPEENSDVCAAFLAEHCEFQSEDFTLPDGTASIGGMLQLWPQRHGTDGFFIAKMRKVGNG